jgi:hypothetical protein
MSKRHDSDSEKGAVESESPANHSPSHLTGQLGHRADPFIKNRDEDNDTDFPEPGNVPEHSGQHE